MKTEMGRFPLTTSTQQALTSARRQEASSEIDAITRRRTRRQSDTSQNGTHESLSEAIARHRQREHPGC